MALNAPTENASEKEVRGFLRKIAGALNGGLILASDVVTSSADWTPEIGTLGQILSYQQVVVSDGGIGNDALTVNATSEPASTMILVLDFTTDYGDISNVTMASQYKVASAPNADDFNHVLVAFIWTGTYWREFARQTTV